MSIMKTHCPKMKVRPVRLFKPLGDRMTDELHCPSTVTINNVLYAFDFVFPKCKVRVNKDRAVIQLPEPIEPYGTSLTPDRIVEEVTAIGVIPGIGVVVKITFDEEASVDLPDRTTDVLPCNGFGHATFSNGRVVDITSRLPRTLSRPGGILGWGWTYYTVDEVDFESTWNL